MCLEYIFFPSNEQTSRRLVASSLALSKATSAANVDGERRRMTALYTEDTYMSHQNKPTETGSIPLIARSAS